MVGAGGQVGSAVRRALENRGARVTTSTRAGGDVAWDLREPRVPTELAAVEADLVVLAGGVATVDACERDPAGSRTVNVESCLAAARTWAPRGAHVVAFSTSQVFDGSVPRPPVTAAPSPSGEYGRQKVDLERALRDVAGRVTVLRLTKVVGPSWSRLIEWRAALESGSRIVAYADLGFSPVPEDGVAAAVVAALAARRTGIVHLSARDEMRYVDFARIVARSVGADPALVDAASAEGTPHARRFSTLGTDGALPGLWSNALTALDVVAGLLV